MTNIFGHGRGRAKVSRGPKKMEPLSKRRKEYECDIDSWVAYPVLSDEQSQDTELIEAFAAPILNKKDTSILIKELALLYPLPGLKHIKRVRGSKGSSHPLEIIVCLASDLSKDCKKDIDISALLPSGRFNYDSLGDPFLVRIPACAPLTRAQFDRASKHWPTSFHEDKQITVALKGQLFTNTQKTRMHAYMMAAVGAAKTAQKSCMEAVGAVLVDPETERVIAVGHDCRRNSHPLHHAVMVCIDLVAHQQGGGAYIYDKYPACQFTLSNSLHSPSHDTMPNSLLQQGVAISEDRGQPYICTGYDLFVTREPCLMCAMALVHSRIGRVFYGATSADGALGTKYKIHTQKDLNHRFEVFKGVMEKQCEDLCS